MQFVKLLTLQPVLIFCTWSPQNVVFDISIGDYYRPIISGFFGTSGIRHDFIIDTQCDIIYHPEVPPTFVLSQLTLVGSSHDEGVVIPRPDSRDGRREIDRRSSIGVGFGSEFAQTVGRMILIPTRIGQFQSPYRMIANPSDPQSVCADRAMIMTNVNVESGHRQTFRLDVTLRHFDNGDSRPLSPSGVDRESSGPSDFPVSITGQYRISTLYPHIRLPLETKRALADTIRREMGLPESQRLSSELPRGCAAIISRLPSIQFSIVNDNGEQMGAIVLSPEDYVEVQPRSLICKLYVDLYSLTDRLNTDLYLGRVFLERVGTFFDYENQQIGFCEPE